MTSNQIKNFNNKFEKFDLYDSKFNLQAFKKNVEVLAEFLVWLQYGIENDDKYNTEITIDEESIQNEIAYYSKNAWIPVQIVKDSPITKHFKNYTSDFMAVKQKTFKLADPKYFIDKELTFKLKY